ncbi:hypothetical protein RJ55_03260 [Drechmeria coniospora]|nr:hypothetical protein RJ55_03260 [Drechmeria coniospora]
MFSGRRTRNHHHPHTTTAVITTHTPRRNIFSRRRHRIAPVNRHQRKPTLKDKISGALTKLRGSLSHRPGLKAAGTRRMHGTDGRRAHRIKRLFL